MKYQEVFQFLNQYLEQPLGSDSSTDTDSKADADSQFDYHSKFIKKAHQYIIFYQKNSLANIPDQLIYYILIDTFPSVKEEIAAEKKLTESKKMQEMILRNKQRIDELKNNVAQNDERIKSLQSDITARKEQIEILQNATDDDITTINSYKGSNAETELEIQKFAQENVRFNEQIAQYEQKNLALQNKTNTLDHSSYPKSCHMEILKSIASLKLLEFNNLNQDENFKTFWGRWIKKQTIADDVALKIIEKINELFSFEAQEFQLFKFKIFIYLQLLAKIQNPKLLKQYLIQIMQKFLNSHNHDSLFLPTLLSLLQEIQKLNDIELEDILDHKMSSFTMTIRKSIINKIYESSDAVSPKIIAKLIELNVLDNKVTPNSLQYRYLWSLTESFSLSKVAETAFQLIATKDDILNRSASKKYFLFQQLLKHYIYFSLCHMVIPVQEELFSSSLRFSLFGRYFLIGFSTVLFSFIQKPGINRYILSKTLAPKIIQKILNSSYKNYSSQDLEQLIYFKSTYQKLILYNELLFSPARIAFFILFSYLFMHNDANIFFAQTTINLQAQTLFIFFRYLCYTVLNIITVSHLSAIAVSQVKALSAAIQAFFNPQYLNSWVNTILPDLPHESSASTESLNLDQHEDLLEMFYNSTIKKNISNYSKLFILTVFLSLMKSADFILIKFYNITSEEIYIDTNLLFYFTLGLAFFHAVYNDYKKPIPATPPTSLAAVSAATFSTSAPTSGEAGSALSPVKQQQPSIPKAIKP